jgi:hypothetical protein
MTSETLWDSWDSKNNGGEGGLGCRGSGRGGRRGTTVLGTGLKVGYYEVRKGLGEERHTV